MSGTGQEFEGSENIERRVDSGELLAQSGKPTPDPRSRLAQYDH